MDVVGTGAGMTAREQLTATDITDDIRARPLLPCPARPGGSAGRCHLSVRTTEFGLGFVLELENFVAQRQKGHYYYDPHRHGLDTG